MGKKDVFSAKNGEDEEEPSGEHEKDENSKDQSKEERKIGMDASQSHHGDIPEHKNQKEEDQTGNDQKTNENSLLGSDFQRNLPKIVQSNQFGVRSNSQNLRTLNSLPTGRQANSLLGF